MKNKIILFIFSMIMILFSGCTTERKENREIVNWVEQLIDYQNEICVNVVGEWCFVDFYTPGTGAPSKDRAEEYINTKVVVLYIDNTLMLKFQDKEYEMACIRPLEQRYFIDTYNYPGGLDSKIINGYAYEISFKKDDESIAIYVNEQGEVYLHINAEVADLACFLLKRVEPSKEIEVGELFYFEGMAEYLLDNCKLHKEYSNLANPTIMAYVEDDSFVGKTIYVRDTEDGVIIQIEDERLQLTSVEDVMGLHVNYKLIRDTVCQENQKALLYSFSNEDYTVQIMERSDGKSFVRIHYKEQDELVIYECFTGDKYLYY